MTSEVFISSMKFIWIANRTTPHGCWIVFRRFCWSTSAVALNPLPITRRLKPVRLALGTLVVWPVPHICWYISSGYDSDINRVLWTSYEVVVDNQFCSSIVTSNGTVGVAEGGRRGCREVAPNFLNFFGVFLQCWNSDSTKSESCYTYRVGQKVSPAFFALTVLITHYTCEKNDAILIYSWTTVCNQIVLNASLC